MDEKRYIFETVEITDCDTDVSRIARVITDKEECYSYEDLCDIAVLLNGKEATIQRLVKENEQLNNELEECKELQNEINNFIIQNGLGTKFANFLRGYVDE